MAVKAPSLNKEKYKNAILYFLNSCNNDYLGRTKLYKLLYYLDFISYRDQKNLVTGDIYIHRDFGPVPSQVENILLDLNQEKNINIESIPYKDHEKISFKSTQKPDLSVFSSYEKKLLENICKEFELWSTDKMVSQTHIEAPWFYSKPYEVVDFNYANDIEFFSETVK